jgi:glucosamine-6-phosphate deaminase
MNSTAEPIFAASFDRLAVRVYQERQAMGEAAAAAVARQMRNRLAQQRGVRIVFAAAPSQNEFLDALAGSSGIDWSRVTAFQMDEYLGLPPDAPQSFGRFLTDRLFDRVRPGAIHRIDPCNGAAAECARYVRLLAAAPIDIVCLGIGENGHLAFNDPPVADFDDPVWMKVVALDAASRRQQVHDGCFPTLAAVPTHALTLTIPALLSGETLFCIVPGPAKQAAVRCALHDAIAPACPASVLRSHPHCTLYLDEDSYGISAG